MVAGDKIIKGRDLAEFTKAVDERFYEIEKRLYEMQKGIKLKVLYDVKRRMNNWMSDMGNVLKKLDNHYETVKRNLMERERLESTLLTPENYIEYLESKLAEQNKDFLILQNTIIDGVKEADDILDMIMEEFR